MLPYHISEACAHLNLQLADAKSHSFSFTPNNKLEMSEDGIPIAHYRDALQSFCMQPNTGNPKPGDRIANRKSMSKLINRTAPSMSLLIHVTHCYRYHHSSVS
jgi:hypothetical protein